MASRLLQPDAVVLGDALVTETQVEIEDGRVVGIHQDRGAEALRLGGTLLPGLVDLQVNGAGGGSVQTATPAVLDVVAETVGRTGAVAFLPTLITAPFDALLDQVRAVAGWIGGWAPRDGVAEPLGLHVEGPFLLGAGAHDKDALCDPTPERIDALLEAGQGRIRLLTLAPQRPGAAAAVERLCAAGVTVSLGHGAGAEGVAECVAAGARMATHLFNVMGPWSHRDPGMPGTILDQKELACGLIVDGIHVHDVWVRHAARLLGDDRLVLVSDCASAMGMPDGEYELAGATVILRDGSVRLRDGTLAGSALSMLAAGENYLRMVPWAGPLTLARVAAANPARLAGAEDRFGSIAVGRAAHFTLLQGDGSLAAFKG